MQRGHVVMVHGWTGWPDEAWRPWMKARLEELDFRVSAPRMNKFWGSFFFPDKDEWVGTISENVVRPTEDTVIISQSLGAVATLRYLEGLQEGEKIGGVVLIAGFTNRLIYPQLGSFFDKPLDYERISQHCDKFEFIHCERDTQVPVDEAYKLYGSLGGRLTVTSHGNHFRHEDGVRELPEALSSVMRIRDIRVPVLSR